MLDPEQTVICFTNRANTSQLTGVISCVSLLEYTKDRGNSTVSFLNSSRDSFNNVL
jgi:hypothetical protein